MTTAEHVEWMTLGGNRIRVATRAGHNGTPVILCNGIGASLELLQPLVDHLSPTRTIVRLDVPGTGRSPTPTLPHTFPGLARALGCLLDRRDYRHTAILGFSWGGALAQQFALQNPRRCRRLILVATATGAIMVPASPTTLAKAVAPRLFRDPDCFMSMAAQIFGGSIDSSTATIAALSQHMRPTSWRGYTYQLLAVAAWNSLFALPLVRQPTLIIAGTDDHIVPVANAHIMNALLPHSRLHLHHGGHLDLVTRPELFGPLIDAFLDQHCDLTRRPTQTDPTCNHLQAGYQPGPARCATVHSHHSGKHPIRHCGQEPKAVVSMEHHRTDAQQHRSQCLDCIDVI
jgi:poly(3-hydroxyalkanoate) depolymerase